MAVLRQAQPLQPTSHIPGDWRSRILDALVGEGVAHTSHVPVWRVLCDFFIPAFGALYLFTLFVQISDIPYQLLESGSFVIAPWGERFWILVTAPIITCALVVGYIIVKPDFSRSTRQIRMALYGTSALRVLDRAQSPPILYLRSFSFDERAASQSRWFERFTKVLGYPLQDDSEEMKVVRAMRAFAPVIAIGRPGEGQPPPGALRFYVRDDLWQDKVKAVAPLCRLIVLATGAGAGLHWEIRHLVDNSEPHRILLWPHVTVGQWTVQERRDEWDRLVVSYRDLFPKPLPSWSEFRKARFIAFDETWTPICIPSQAYRPTLWDLLTSRFSTHGLKAFLRAQTIRPD
jgi:hypothetical protein